MSQTALRFRCPQCRRYHSVAASKAGRPFVCPTCFGAMVVPEAVVAARSGMPIARSIEVPTPACEIAPAGPTIVHPVAGLGAEDCNVRPDPATPDESPDAEQVEEWTLAGTRPPAVAVMGALVAAFALIVVVCVTWGFFGSRGEQHRRNRLLAADLPTSRTFADEGLVRRGLPAPHADAPQPTRPAPETKQPAARLEPAPAIVVEPVPRPADLPMSPAPALGPVQVPAVPFVEEPVARQPIPPAAAVAPPPLEPANPPAMRRRQPLDQEELRKQLATLPELALRARTANALVAPQGATPAPRPQFNGPFAFGSIEAAIAVEVVRRNANLTRRPPQNSRELLALIMRAQPELSSLPWRMGDDCHLGREPAESLGMLSRALRDLLQRASPGGEIGPDPERLRPLLLDVDAEEIPRMARPGRSVSRPNWVDPSAIPALMQMMVAERTPMRQLLVDVLARIQGTEAVGALARLALFDIAPEVRDRAILALRARPVEDSRPTLIGGFRYPWAPVADHAAEALIALEDRGAIPDLVKLLDRPDPQGPTIEVRKGRPTSVVRTLVRINHLKNCLLCHAPSTSPSTDLVRGRVPTPSEPLPPPQQYYGDSPSSLFVRADLTYLRQDFSAIQPVEDPAPWPRHQRYDYLVTERPTTSRDRVRNLAEKTTYAQRESALFALRGLNGKDLGTTSEAWRAGLLATRTAPPGGASGE